MDDLVLDQLKVKSTDKKLFSTKRYCCFPYFLTKTYAEGTH